MRNHCRDCIGTYYRSGTIIFALCSTLAFGAAGIQQDEVIARLQRGMQLFAASRPEEAIVELEVAVRLDPENWEVRYHLGRALYASGRAENAVTHLIAALGSSPEPGPVQYMLAQVLLQLEEWQAAADALDATEEEMPGFPPVAYYRGELCYRLGRVEVARRYVERAAESLPDWDRPLLSAATLAEEEDDSEAAVGWYRAALELRPDDQTLWVRLGSALAAAEKPRESVAAYRRALEIDPDFEAARIRLLSQLDMTGNRATFDNEINGILEREPDSGLARYRRAQLLNQEGRFQEALVDIDRAIRSFLEAEPAAGQDLDTVVRNARGFRARLLMQLGRSTDAAVEARALVQEYPWYPEPLFVLGTILMRQGDPEGRSLLQRFKSLSDAREHRRTAGGLLRRGDLDDAIVEYRAARRSAPDEHTGRVGLALALRRRGDHQEALALLLPPTTEASLLAEWYRELVLALYNNGRVDEARQLWGQLRTRGFVLGAEVWRVMRSAVATCN